MFDCDKKVVIMTICYHQIQTESYAALMSLSRTFIIVAVFD
jgi:hypothetical protein